ncbi:MAG: phosphatase PAP2 family protein, partial [Pseudomonadales bacterium]|nr:phosphatase PAP2 family protein [Pseudomonadales bacterium]
SADKQTAFFFKVISRLGDGWFWYALIAALAFFGGQPAYIYLMETLLVSGLGVAIYKYLKQHTLRPRPYQVHQAIVLGERPLDHFSFPSGHTLHAVLFTIMLGSQWPVLLTILVPFMLLVALSRMILGLHYPTDVLVGAVLGASLASSALILLA